MKPTPHAPGPDDDHPAPQESDVDLLWQQFLETHPTEEACIEELLKRLAGNGYRTSCRNCGSDNVRRSYGKRTVYCRNCRTQKSITAETFFDRMRSARPWLFAIWLMEHGINISAFRFHNLAGIAYSSALTIFKKLSMVIARQMEACPLSLSSGAFIPVFCKRSLETPARRHPVAEEEELGRSTPPQPDNAMPSPPEPPSPAPPSPAPGEPADDDTALSVSLSDAELTVYRLISREPLQFDALCHHSGMTAGELSSVLTMLELQGLVMRNPGDCYTRHGADNATPITANPAPSPQMPRGNTTKAVTRAIDFILRVFHGISRKCLQLYLASYWCHVDRVRWGENCLLRECLSFGPIRHRDIISYVSPPLVAAATSFADF